MKIPRIAIYLRKHSGGFLVKVTSPRLFGFWVRSEQYIVQDLEDVFTPEYVNIMKDHFMGQSSEKKVK